MIGFIIMLIGGGNMKMARVVTPVLDTNRNQTYRDDGSVMYETNQWENFKHNWIGYTGGYIGLVAIVWGIGSWLYVGLRPHRKMISDSEAG